MKKQMMTWVMTVFVTGTFAQSVTYNHDASKKNQITVMETGSGSLTPELYYWTLHNNYKKSAASKNKLGFRTTAGINLYNQIPDAEKIDSVLTRRAEIEALNVADRQIDLAWKVEKEKINTQLDKLQSNINHIIPTGGSLEDKKHWEELYSMYQCAVKATREAYMPNARRKVEYLRIYDDLTRQNDILLKFLVQCDIQGRTSTLLSAVHDYAVNKGDIVGNARSRWKENMKGVHGSYRDDETGENQGNETVNR